MAYETGRRIVEMVWEDLKPSDIMTREAFENVIVANAAIGGSTNAPIHINAIAKHIGVPLDNDDWERIGFEIPLLVNMQPAGEYLGEEYFRAGGLPAVIAELIERRQDPRERAHLQRAGPSARTAAASISWDRRRDPPLRRAAAEKAGFLNLKGTLFDSRDHEDERDLARSSRSAISTTRRIRTPSRARSWCSTGPEDYHHRIDDPVARHRRAHDPDHARRRADRLSGRRRGREHAAAGRAHQARACSRCPASATAASPAPRARPRSSTPRRRRRPAAASRCCRRGDRIRIDLNKRQRRHPAARTRSCARRRADLEARGGFAYPASQTPWQEIQRSMVDQLSEGMTLKPAVKYQQVAQTFGRAARQPLEAARRPRSGCPGRRHAPGTSHPGRAPWQASPRRAHRLPPPARERLLRDAEPLGHRHRALSAPSRLQGAGHHELGLRVHARACPTPTGPCRGTRCSATSPRSSPRPTCR